MYIKIGKAVDLDKALDIEFEKINSSLRLAVQADKGTHSFSYVRIEKETKFRKFTLLPRKNFTCPDFWKDGVCLAGGSTVDITQLAKAIDFWLCNEVTTKELSEKYNFIESNNKAVAFDEGIEIPFINLSHFLEKYLNIC